MEIKQYSKKAFLHEDSMWSSSIFHARIDEDGVVNLIIHDCNHSIRIWNDLTKPGEALEMITKLKSLETAISGLRQFIEENYL